MNKVFEYYKPTLMKSHLFEKKTIIKKPLPEVFDFFSKAENLDKITPPHLYFKILTPSPIVIKKGTIIDYQLKLYGVPFKWKTEITKWDPPYSFEDSQISGPYKKWVHQHFFEEKNGEVHMKDIVEYLSPGWLLEPLIDLLFVGPNVQRIFNYRETFLKSYFS